MSVSGASSFDTTLSSLGIKRQSTSPAVGTAAAANTLNQSDFLKLMTAQMQNQDPFNPVDNTQMVAQMAQFSSLAGISEMATTLKAIQDKLGATTASDAMAYIGKTVQTAGSTAFGRTDANGVGAGLAGAVELGAATSRTVVTIADANGSILRQIDLGAQKAGTATYDWDGRTASGDDAGTGPFTISVAAENNGATVAATNLVWAPVQSVSTTTGQAVLSLPGIGDVPVTAVRQIG